MKKICLMTVLAATFASAGAFAQSGQWEVSVGPTYRTFGDIDVQDMTLSHPGGNFLNGEYTDGGNYTILDDSQLQPGGWSPAGGAFVRSVSFDRARVVGGSEEADESFSGMIEMATDIEPMGQTLDLVLGFAIHTSSTDMHLSDGDGLQLNTLTGVLTSPIDPGAGQPPAPYTVVGGAGYPLSNPQDLGDAATTAAMLDLDTDLDMFVYSAGLRKGMRCGAFRFSVGVGGTLNIIDFDTRMRQQATYLDDGSQVYTSRTSDSVLEPKVGLYGSASAGYQITESLALILQGRYDTVFGDVETDLAEIDLDGYSIQAMLGWRF